MLGGIVLCGGLSTRMGRPKALLPWRGGTLIGHVVGVLCRVVRDVVVVTSAELDLPPLEARVVRDREPRLGPLGGLREGLEALEADLAFATSTDAPFLTPEFVTTMLSFGGAAAPEIGGFVQSLSAAYPKALAAKAGELIAAGRMRPLFLLEAGGYRRVTAEELPDCDSVRSLNAPEDYLDALRRDGQSGPATVELLGVARARSGVATVDAPPGMLEDALRRATERAKLALDDHFVVALNGRVLARDAKVPVGPGDRVLIMDAAAGG
jgi:molybdopterin-guanine dinucleotide biosynthesis protein A